MGQGFIKDTEKPVSSLLKEIKEVVSEEIAILRFVRCEVGEEDGDSTDPPRSPANVVRLHGRK